jgi:hypothetical protein
VTARERVLNALPVGFAKTAVGLSYELGLKTASLSSLLKKMCDEGQLARAKGYGPRGGYGYFKRPLTANVLGTYRP